MKQAWQLVICVLLMSEFLPTCSASDSVYDRLNAEDVARLSEAGADGDPTAAHRLFVHYALQASDTAKADWWEQVAAENGSVVSQYGLWIKFGRARDPAVARRGRFWLRKAAASGHSDAVNDLEGLLRESMRKLK